jgi:hypothetical protein
MWRLFLRPAYERGSVHSIGRFACGSKVFDLFFQIFARRAKIWKNKKEESAAKELTSCCQQHRLMVGSASYHRHFCSVREEHAVTSLSPVVVAGQRYHRPDIRADRHCHT